MLGDVRKKESKGSGSIADLVVGQKKLQVQLI